MHPLIRLWALCATGVALLLASAMTAGVSSCGPGSLGCRSSSGAAPRRPPSGFLISCASCRTIARLPPSCVNNAFSRRIRWCWVTSAISTTTPPG